MKKIIVLLLLPLLLCGCVEMEQIEELAFVKIVGIDKAEDGLTVSVGIKLPENEQGQKIPGQDFIAVECSTLAQGLNMIESISESKIFYGQVSSILLGEGIARDGILQTLDFMMRSKDFRLDLPVLVVKNDTAKHLIAEGTGDTKYISEKIDVLLTSAYSTSVSGKVQLSKLIEMMEDPYRAPSLPYLDVSEDISQPRLAGYCIFKKDKLACFLNRQDSVGLNYLNNNIEEIVVITQVNDSDITLKLSQSKTKIKFADEVFQIQVYFLSEVLQAENGIEEFSAEIIDELVVKQNEIVQNLIEGCIKKLQENDCDAADFGGALYRCKPQIGEEYRENWEKKFAAISCQVEITSKIDKSKSAGKPADQRGV